MEFLNEESVGGSEEWISRQMMFEVFEDVLSGLVDVDDGSLLGVAHLGGNAAES